MKNRMYRGLAAAACCLSLALSAWAPAGGDVYEIYLNEKLLIRQPVHQPVAVKSLSLAGAAHKDRVRILYSHCGIMGKDRQIMARDGSERVIKTWAFRDASSSRDLMAISVKELVTLEKQSGTVRLHYVSRELPAGKLLAQVVLPGKATAHHRSAPAPRLAVR